LNQDIKGFMSETPRSALVGHILLTFVTGLVDAASVLGLGHVFTANMTGNIVFLGFALAGTGTASVSASLLALGSFLIGAIAGGRLVRPQTPRVIRIAFGTIVGALVAAGVLGFVAPSTLVFPIVSLLAFAMGLRNSVVRKLGVSDMPTTVLTLTLTGLAADSHFAGGTNPRWVRRVIAVVVMLAGAWSGAMLLPLGVGWVIALAAAIEAVAAVLVVRSGVVSLTKSAATAR
jgi:uncharacterized membrane protein YoaK (UPF0700 family)